MLVRNKRGFSHAMLKKKLPEKVKIKQENKLIKNIFSSRKDNKLLDS